MLNIVYALVLFPVGFSFGYFFSKYRQYENELSYSLTVIKEDLISMQIKLENLLGNHS